MEHRYRRALSRIALGVTGILIVGLASAPGSPAGAAGLEGAARAERGLMLEPGDSRPKVGVLQKRLTWLGYAIDRDERKREYFGATTTTAVLSFQEKFFLGTTAIVKSRAWRILHDAAGRIGWLPVGCRTGRVICIDMDAKLLRYLVDGKVKLTLDARFGFEGADTREGAFTVYWKNRDQWSSAFDAPMPFSMFFSRGQAIHFSPYFKEDGYYGASHGCVNIRDREAARWMFDNSPIGTPVIIYSGKD